MVNEPRGRGRPGSARRVLREASVPAEDPGAIRALAAALGPDLAQVLLFVSAEADFPTIIAEAEAAFVGARIAACTTAGEIDAQHGYADGRIVAVGLPRRNFATDCLLVTDLDRMVDRKVIAETIRARMALETRAPDLPHAFGFVVVDGLSKREDQLMSVLAAGLGTLPVFGGSAGDGVRFDRTHIALDGVIWRNAAILVLVRTLCPVRVFSFDHFEPGTERMVVTRADPEARLVFEINARPAAREYARILGKDPDGLSPFIFAAHPPVVRVGGRHHVRAIQRVTEDGALVFFSAIDEGIVLTLARPGDIASHLDDALGRLADPISPAAILASDCVLRRIEATQKQVGRRMSQALAGARVVGFNTYGEQIGAAHVNQTMTGVAIYPPEADAEDGGDR